LSIKETKLKVMSEELKELSLNEINNKLIENYQTQVSILKSMIADRDKLIALYEKQLLIQDRYIEGVREDMALLENSLLR
jgi:hypothetical protein